MSFVKGNFLKIYVLFASLPSMIPENLKEHVQKLLF